METERTNGEFVLKLIESKSISTCHDVSDGGILVAISEMILASLSAGFEIGANISKKCRSEELEAWLFGEDQGLSLIHI